MKNILLKVSLVVLLLSISFSQLYVESSLALGARPYVVPIGTDDVILYRFTISSNANDTWQRVVFSKNSTFNSEWVTLKVYPDFDDDGKLSNEEKTYLINKNRESDNYGADKITINYLFQDLFLSFEPIRDYLVAVNISTTADINNDLWLSPNAFYTNNGDTAIISENVSSYNFELGKLNSFLYTSSTENYFIGDDELEVFKVELRLTNDTFCWVTFDFKINYPIENKGIGELRIYRDGYTPPVVTAELKSQDNLLIGMPYDVSNLVSSTSTKNFYIRYFINTYSDTGISFNIEINDIYGSYASNGAKGFPYYSLETFNSKDIKIAGIYPNIKVITMDSLFVGGQLPVFNIQFSSYYLISTINTIELEVTGDFIFSNTLSNNVIQEVLIKQNNSSTITISVGDYNFVDDDTIRITINKQVQNYLINNESMSLDIVYVLTNNIFEARELKTKIKNIVYTPRDGFIYDFSAFLQDNDYSVFNMLGEAVIRIDSYFLTSNHKINFPRGGDAQQIAYFDFSYLGVPIFDTMVRVDTFVIENLASLPIDKLNLYFIYDSNGNGVKDSSDYPIIKENLNKEYDLVANKVTINQAQILLINDQPSKAYFLMMEIVSTANTGIDNISLKISEILYYREFKEPLDEAKIAVFSNRINDSITVSVTGLLMEQEKRGFNLNYRQQDSFTLATFSIISLVRLTEELSFDLLLKSNSNQNLGVLNIVKSYAGGTYPDTSIVTINSMVVSTTNIGDPNSFSMVTYDHSELTRNYKLIYTPNKTIEAGITFDLIIKNIEGAGYENGYETKCFSDNLTVNIGLAGLRVTFDSALVSGTYIDNMDIPVFRCGYASFYDNTTFNGLSLAVSSNSFKFSSTTDEDRIKKIYVYSDNNNNQVWDNDDSLLFNYDMSLEKLEEVFLTLNLLVVSGSVNSDLFIVYVFSTYQTIESQVSVKSAINEFYYQHSGDVKVITVNKYNIQDIVLEPVQYIFTPGDDLFPSINYEGAYDVPILSFKIRSNQSNNTSSYNFLLETNKDLYSNNDLGIRSVKLLEDVDNSNTYTSMDKVLDIVNDFSNIGRYITLNIHNVYLNDRTYLILYTLGQKMSDIPNISDEALRPRLYTISISTASVKTAGLFPYPRNTRYMAFVSQGVTVEFISITPNKWITGDLNLILRITNGNAEKITINSVYPQFYEEGLSSLNVTYLYNIGTTLNFPFVLTPSEQLIINYTVSTDREFRRDRLFLDALVEYLYGTQQIRLQRRDLYGWERLLTADQAVDVDVPEVNIFYLDYPNYIEKVIRSKSGIAFLNGDIIGNDEYLIFYLKDTISNLDTNKIMVKLDGVTLNMYSSEPNCRYDSQTNTIRIGKYSKGEHTVVITLYDNAGNMYPEASIALSVYDPDLFYIKDLLVYPSRKSQDSFSTTPLKVGFQLSKSCDVQLYLFNSRGESVWTNKYTATLVDDYYQLLDFNGILDNGMLIPKGMYILKAIIIENGKQKDAKINTRFIIN